MVANKNPFSGAADKLLLFPDRLEAWMNNEAVTPITLEIHPTERCTHRCPDCHGQDSLGRQEQLARSRNGQDLDLRWLDSVWELPPQGIVLSGHTGDPLMHPEIDRLFHILIRQGIPVALITNGEELTADIAKLALQICRGIRISFDAYDASSFRRTHGRDEEGWERILHNVRQLIELRREAGISSAQCSIGVGYLVDERTAGGMASATSLAQSLGVDYIHFRPYLGRAHDYSAVLPACLARVERQGFQVLNSDQRLTLLRTKRSYDRCQGAWFNTFLSPRGDLYMCCHHIGKPEARIGSLRQSTWKEWVKSQERRTGIEGFDTESCVAHCRMDHHNRDLARLKTEMPREIPNLPPSVVWHAPFL